jgi:hypothetical protein
MHYAHCVALFGMIPESEVEARLNEAMDRYYYDNDEGNDGQWDWFVVGGRWGGSWILKEGGVDGPLETQASTFGLRRCEDESCHREHTDCARLVWLEFESLQSPYSWIDLGGVWRTKWLGPEGSGSQEAKDWEIPDETWTKEWLAFIQDCPPDTWFVLVDVHN